MMGFDQLGCFATIIKVVSEISINIGKAKINKINKYTFVENDIYYNLSINYIIIII